MIISWIFFKFNDFFLKFFKFLTIIISSIFKLDNLSHQFFNSNGDSRWFLDSSKVWRLFQKFNYFSKSFEKLEIAFAITMSNLTPFIVIFLLQKIISSNFFKFNKFFYRFLIFNWNFQYFLDPKEFSHHFLQFNYFFQT